MADHQVATRERIKQTLRDCGGQFARDAEGLLGALGYRSERTLEGQSGDVSDFLDQFPADNPDTKAEREFRDAARSVRLIFQLTDQEIEAGLERSMFPADEFDSGLARSFLFAAVELDGARYPRGKYAQFTRELNKRFGIPTVVLFHSGDGLLTLAFVHRREHKRDPDRDVLGSVSLIRELDPAKPHRAHIDILEQLSLANRLDWMQSNGKPQNFDGLLDAWLDALDTEELNRRFYREYKRLFDQAVELVSGFSEREREQRRRFVLTLLNRLMFVQFLSRKGWLAYRGDRDYLNALKNDYLAHEQHDNFYRDRLSFLFFEGLNNPDSRDLRHGLDILIGDVPFLNGGLFQPTELDQRDNLFVPDDAILPVLSELFDRFYFTVSESTPLEIEVAVDPEMLGMVFEELVTGRHDSGAYYTPRPVVSFMCREALKGYLEARLPVPASRGDPLDADAVAAFVDRRDTARIRIPDARAISNALADVTVVDPACGSGAYLLGMMHELVELQQTLFNVTHDPKSLYELKLEIIRRNLYGVDIDGFATNIAMLRLWLSLAIDYEGDQPEPLPNLDFKIVQGDSLLGPDPSETGQQGVLGYEGTRIDRLRELKRQFMTEYIGDRKQALRQSIEAVEADIRERLSHFAQSGNALDWRVEFAEVFADGGFDIVIANPPYIQLQKDSGKLGKRYADCGFETFVRSGDIYQLFFERGCQLLRRDGGLMAYISSNSWLRAEYGKKTRRHFAQRHTPLRWLDLGKDVFDSAIVDSGVLLLRTGRSHSAGSPPPSGDPFPSVDLDALPDKQIPPADQHWGQTRPNGDAPWSVLSHTEWSVMDKMLDRGTPLSEWDVKINRGVLTGYNKAFIIDTPTRDALIAEDPNSDEIIKPVLRGRDIQRYRAEWAGKWLIDTHNGYDDVPPINIDDYPAVKDHLDGFLPQVERRQDQGLTYYNLRSCAYYEDFAKPKLLWIELVDRGRFAYDDSKTYPEATTFLMTGENLKYLCALLNSRLMHWHLRQIAPTSGMGTLRWKRVYVERLPLPKPSKEEQQPFVQLVDRILNAATPDTDAEQEIDQLVYNLYGLTDDEIAAVEGRVSR